MAQVGLDQRQVVLQDPGRQLLAVGSLTQCAAPVAAGVVFFRQRDDFGISVALAWLATNLWGVAVYAADARAMQLHLVSPGMGMAPASEGSITHDWNHLLGLLGWLEYDTAIAACLRVAAYGTMGLALVTGGWLLAQMALGSREA